MATDQTTAAQFEAERHRSLYGLTDTERAERDVMFMRSVAAEETARRIEHERVMAREAAERAEQDATAESAAAAAQKRDAQARTARVAESERFAAERAAERVR